MDRYIIDKEASTLAHDLIANPGLEFPFARDVCPRGRAASATLLKEDRSEYTVKVSDASGCHTYHSDKTPSGTLTKLLQAVYGSLHQWMDVLAETGWPDIFFWDRNGFEEHPLCFVKLGPLSDTATVEVLAKFNEWYEGASIMAVEYLLLTKLLIGEKALLINPTRLGPLGTAPVIDLLAKYSLSMAATYKRLSQLTAEEIQTIYELEKDGKLHLGKPATLPEPGIKDGVRLCGGYVTVYTYAALTDAEEDARATSSPYPIEVLVVKEPFLAQWVAAHSRWSTTDDFFDSYSLDEVDGLKADAFKANALALTYKMLSSNSKMVLSDCGDDALTVYCNDGSCDIDALRLEVLNLRAASKAFAGNNE